MEKYNPKKIEKKWQKKWEEKEIYKAEDPLPINWKGIKKPKKYILIEFPYPSGAGLHIGHCRPYCALDALARKKKMEGNNVLFPIGWDAFGLPTENFAIKNKIHPQEATKKNIANFKKQIKSLGLSFDWSREINTTDPKYYKWTQWIFLKLFENGLAYQAEMPINWCPSCKIGLANEEVVSEKCERCGATTKKKIKKQWMLKITAYADKLIEGLKKVDYPERVKTQQINWIGKSEGATIKFQIANSKSQINSKFKIQNSKFFLEVFTTRPDTLFGCTYMVVCPEHSLIQNSKFKIQNYNEVEKYLEKVKKKSDLERTDLAKEKTGVELKGIKAINPVNNKEIPIFVADYVLPHYGTGSIMAVPAHDERDFEFAKKYGLEIKQVIAPFFKTIKGKDAVRLDKPIIYRQNVHAFVKHWKEDKFLCLDWKKQGWHSAIIGGIKDGEDVIEAGKREVYEETGYKNLKFTRRLCGEIHNTFFAGHKNENRYSIEHPILFKLIDGERDQTNKEETKYHNKLWINANEVEDFLNLENIKFMWSFFKKEKKCFTEEGININSDFLDGLKTKKAKEKIIKWLEENSVGKKAVNYKLRDWIFSRQHYWGEPIPLVHCKKCGIVPIPEKDLPVELPYVEKYQPTKTGESPLTNISKWVNVKCPKCGHAAKRETDTMPNWAGSSWYYLRYLDPKNDKALADFKKIKYWIPVDFYNGGMEHTTLHLLYSRFWHKFLFDIGVVPQNEPYQKRTSHGMVLAKDGRKMSKSFGNVINPDDVVKKFGADALRLYEMFMGPFEQTISWNTDGLTGMRRFLDRIWKVSSIVIASEVQPFLQKGLDAAKQSRKDITDETNNEIAASLPEVAPHNDALERLLHQTIKKVSEDIDNFKFNTAIAQLMILLNKMEKEKLLFPVHCLLFIKLLSPFAPHICEEIYSSFAKASADKQNSKQFKSIFKEEWPKYDEKLIKEEKINLIIQINGKVRDQIEVDAEILEQEAKEIALSREKVVKWIKGKEIKKIIFVKGKLINIVI